MHRIGLIGCGEIASEHVTGLAATGRARVTSVWDIDPRTAAARAAEWGVKAMPSAQAVAESDVDSIVVATPGFARVEYVVAAAANGKHILCEKPVALTLADAESIRAAVCAAGVTFMVHFKQRFNPALETLRNLGADGKLGGVVSAWARLHAPAPTARWLQIVESGHWRASAELSGGRINEFCSHTVNWLLWVLGPARSVYGKALRATEGFTLDDADLAVLNCTGGTGLLDVHRHAGVAEDASYGIVGHKGSAVLRDGRIFLTAMDGPTREIPADPDGVTPHAHFLDCIDSGAEPRNGLEDAIETLNVCLAFNRSALSGAVERV